jgi:HPt (histidine-containing phosphotransfer) domain-containing protein
VDRLLSRHERYLSLLQRFVATQSAPDAALPQAMRAGDRAAARLEAHGLKGAAASLCALALADQAARLEAALRQGSQPLADDVAVQQAWNEVRQTLAVLAARMAG